MKVLAFPRDPNPYQELLYAEAAALGAEVAYLGKVTPLGSLNLLLLPVELAVRRMSGARIVHLHWVWAFLVPGAGRFPVLRRASWGWFRLCLRVIRLLGLRLAWTAHNVLPHSPVFPDDIAARRRLVSQCDVVFGHSSWTLSGLTEIGAVPRRWAMIRHAPFGHAAPVSSTSRPSRTNGTRELLFFGKVFEYKGVEDLLEALARLPESHRVHLTVAGQCGDAGIRSRIEASARRAGNRVSLRLQHIPDSDVGQLMRKADVVVLPFRRITTSGSALLALSYGKPLVIPALPALADLPDGAAFRYDGSVEGLAATLQSVIAADDSLLARMSAAALAYCSEATWHQAASTTVAEFRKVLGEHGPALHEAGTPASSGLVGRDGSRADMLGTRFTRQSQERKACHLRVPLRRSVLRQQTLAQDRSQAADASTKSYDVLILDAAYKQSLICARSLGRTGLRVALGEMRAESYPPAKVPAFKSRYCARSLVLPDYVEDVAAYTSAITEFVRQHPTRVVLPTGDATIAALAPMRAQFAALGSVLALAPDSALAVANDKARTLQVAAELGIAAPRSIQVGSVDDLAVAIDEFGFPFVLKPTISWTGKSRYRVVPTEVVDRAEAIEVTRSFLGAGAGVLAQEWAGGRREGATLFIADGDVRVSCGNVTHRATPPLGGASAVRESIRVPDDILDPAIRLAKAIGIEGPCEVEFRRDASGRPLLMEINPRLAGTLENAIHSGIDLPLMVWRWATGQQVERVASHRTGVRTRWLQGDLRWLGENHQRIGRPDSVPWSRSLWLFCSEFARTRHYDVVDWHDMRPILTELGSTARIIVKAVQNKVTAEDQGSKEGVHVE